MYMYVEGRHIHVPLRSQLFSVYVSEVTASLV